MTQEFHLSITALGNDRYLIRTEDTATGVPLAEVQAEWPVEDWLKSSQPALDDPLLGVLRGNTDAQQSASGLHQLGAQLYDALFATGALQESWLRAQGIAQNRNEILRFRLGLKESRLQRLPWEVMQQGGHPLTTRSDLTFARYVANFMVSQALETEGLLHTEPTLRVLMAIASPHDQEHLKIYQEAKHLQELLAAENGTTHPIQIEVLEQPDRSELAHALEQGNFQIFHYSGHSDFGENGGDLSLVNRQTGLTERLSGDDLAGLLVNNRVALTVFNSCRSGHTAEDDAAMDWRQQNLVQALVNRGVPGVIAMAERIPDDVAIAFTQLLYKNLRQGYPIDLSLSRTRQGLISAFGSNQHYWALPILYLHPDFDGYFIRSDRESDAALDPAELEFIETSASPSLEVTPPEVATAEVVPGVSATDVLTQLENTTPVDSDPDLAVANFVKELSGRSGTSEDPPLPASQEEVLVLDQSEQTGLDIYNALPELPTQNPDVSAPPESAEVKPLLPVQNGQSSQFRVTQRGLSDADPDKKGESSALIWFALGLVGVIGVIGLGSWSLWRSGLLSSGEAPVREATTVDAPVNGPLNADTLLTRATEAIAEERYADARDDLALALNQELIGNAPANEVSSAVRTLVINSSEPDMLYILGRLHWQAMTQFDSSTQPELNPQSLAQQAQEAWEQTELRSLENRIARGFAHYVLGSPDRAIENWEAALDIYDPQRQAQPDPASTTPVDDIILHAYAGLVMAHTQIAEEQLDTVDTGFEELSAPEEANLRAEADRQRAYAREAFLNLQKGDPNGLMSPEQLGLITDVPATWHNWLWTLDLINEWAPIHDRWEAIVQESES